MVRATSPPNLPATRENPMKLNESLRAEAEEVIDILNRWDKKLQGHQTQKRTHERTGYAVPIRLYGPKVPSRGTDENAVITVWARNVSQRGVGFIYKGQIRSKRVILCLDPDSGETAWFLAEIVRSRQVHNEFWDYGARFVSRATREDVATLSQTSSHPPDTTSVEKTSPAENTTADENAKPVESDKQP